MQAVAPQPQFSVSSFGSLVVLDRGELLWKAAGGKIASLFAYLATEPGAHSREHLADLFFPEVLSATARLNLRQLLFRLQKELASAIGHNPIHASRHFVEIKSDVSWTVTSIDFMAPLPYCKTPGTAECDACLAKLTAQAELFNAPFLADISLPDSQEFERWLQFKRDLIQQQALNLYAHLADCHERMGNYTMASHFASRYTELEPWSESGHSRLMRLHLLGGKYEKALSQYEACHRALNQELGVMPSLELQKIAERLRQEVPRLAPTESGQERRQVTVLYCSIQTSKVYDDPEDALHAVHEPQTRCASIIAGFNGHVVRAYDGGLLAYFGYPQAMENSAVQALRAARAVAARTTAEHAIRVGLHNGLIIASPQTPDAVGTTSRIAIRLRDRAGAGEVIVSSEVQRMAAGFFKFKPLGEKRLNNELRSQTVYRVTGESAARHRLAAAQRLTPFVGRTTELAQMREFWSDSKQGNFNALLISGDAGIGKSRLVATFREHKLFDAHATSVHEMRCFSDARHSPMQPLSGWLAALCQIHADDDDAKRMSKLGAFLKRHTPGLAENCLPILANMMALNTEGQAYARAALPEHQASVMSRFFLQLIHSLAVEKPLLLVVEDMHWADDTTTGLLHALVSSQIPAPIFIVLTARTEWQANWVSLKKMSLMPLSNAETASMIESLHHGMQPEQISQIALRSEGIPLFAEELASMQSHEKSTQQESDLPTTLHDLFMSKFDALGSGRAIAQLAATFGREVDIGLLSKLAEMEPEKFTGLVDGLLQSGLMQKTGAKQIRFKHALIQDAAYLSQTRQSRKAAHRRIAQAIEMHDEQFGRETPERLAQHWQAAGEARQAVPLWLAAGRRAAAQFAHSEAIKHYEAGLEQVQNLPDSSEKVRNKIALLLGLAQSDQVISGYGNPRSVQLLSEAEEMLANSDVGNARDLFSAVWGLWEGAGSQQNLLFAISHAERLINIAKNAQAPDLLAQGHYALGNSLFWHGDFRQSRKELETALKLLPANNRLMRDYYGSIVAVGIHCYLSWSILMQGETALAFTHSEKSVAIAREANEAYSLAFSLTMAATLHRWAGELEKAYELAEEGRIVAKQCASTVFEVGMDMTCGWLSAMQGNPEALEFLEQCINAMKAAMNAVVIELSAMYADALLSANLTEKALPVLSEALALVDVIHDRHCLAELHRMMGVCLIAHDRLDEARKHFEEALAVAREQGAKLFERRALESAEALRA